MLRGIPRLLFYFIVFCTCAMAGPAQTQDQPPKLSPARMKEDIDYLTRVITSVHPDPNFFNGEKAFASKAADCRKKLDGPLSLSEFYTRLDPVVNALSDEHTMLYPPQAQSPREQFARVEEIYRDIKGRHTVSANTYRIDDAVCILTFNTCGSPNESESYADFFRKMFAEMNDRRVTTLIIDIRNNQGGYSGNGSELLRYIASAPFRQYENAARKITPESLAFYARCDIDLLTFLRKDFDTSAIEASRTGQLTPGKYTTEARYVRPADEALRFKGTTCVLLGRNVFSSGLLFANTVQRYGMAPLIGVETRWKLDRQHLGDVILDTLPNSGLALMVSTTVFTVKRPDRTTSERILPDHLVPPGASKDTDPVLQCAIELTRKQQSP